MMLSSLLNECKTNQRETEFSFRQISFEVISITQSLNKKLQPPQERITNNNNNNGPLVVHTQREIKSGGIFSVFAGFLILTKKRKRKEKKEK